MRLSVILISLLLYSNSYANFCSGLLTKVYQPAANYTTDSVKILDKLKSNDPLGFLEKTWIKTEVKHIPFPEQRISILEKIKNKQPLSDIELNNISLYIGTKYKNKKLLGDSFYVDRFIGGDQNLKITFGLEFEFTLQRNLTVQKIKESKRNFLKEVEKIVDDVDLEKLTEEQVKQLQVLNSRFAHEVNLSELFSKFRDDLPEEFIGQSPSKLHTLPVYEDIMRQSKEYTFNSKTMNVPVYNGSDLIKKAGYSSYKKNSVEILFYNVAPFGHLEARIGDNVYSFSNVQFTVSKQFTTGKSGGKGYVYRVNREQIEQASKEIDKIYESSAKYNIPPFDSYGGEVEMVLRDGKYYLTKETSHNSNLLNGSIETFGDKKYLVSPNGFKMDVIERDGKMFVKAYNCTNSIFAILQKKIGFDLGDYISATSANKALSEGNTRIIPDAVVDY